jgi:hypothetical protein
VDVTPCGHLHDQVEGIIAPGTCLLDLFCEFGKPFRSGEIDREQPVPSNRPSDRPPIGPGCRDPDGNPGALHRERPESPAPEPAEPFQTLIQQASALAWVDDLTERPKVVGMPSPTPSVRRPLLRWSSVTVSRATFSTRLRDSGVIIGPSRRVSVTEAMAPSATHGSATAHSRGG